MVAFNCPFFIFIYYYYLLWFHCFCFIFMGRCSGLVVGQLIDCYAGLVGCGLLCCVVVCSFWCFCFSGLFLWPLPITPLSFSLLLSRGVLQLSRGVAGYYSVCVYRSPPKTSYTTRKQRAWAHWLQIAGNSRLQLNPSGYMAVVWCRHVCSVIGAWLMLLASSSAQLCEVEIRVQTNKTPPTATIGIHLP
ncbi:hypothetical protein DFP73DRAFT_532760 [Morchella snyderi]|nr:hypothetical protein DFP73DRAFT_532760 [Morchella snyderi]